MFGNYIYETRRLMEIRRYQNKFRFKNRSVAEHQWSVCRIALGLGLWQNSYSDTKVDMANLLQRALLHDSIKIFSGDIQASPENKAFISEALKEVNDILYDTNFKQLLPQSWQEPFKEFVLDAKDDSVEGKVLITANYIDKILECIEEIELGNNKCFRGILSMQTKRLINLDIDVAKWFIAYCLEDFGLDIQKYYGNEVAYFITYYREEKNFMLMQKQNFSDYKKTFGKYIYAVRDLMLTERYQNLYRHKRRTVAMHEWSVSCIAQGLAIWETNKFNNPVDMYRLLSTTIVHDTPEFIVGDVLSGAKRTTARMLEAVEKREEEAFDNEISCLLPKSWHEEFRKKMLAPKDDTIEGKIVSAADVIDTILESVEEIKLGNREHFIDVLCGSTEKLLDIDLPSVRYFLQYSLHDFGLNIREFYGERVYDYIQYISNSNG